MFEEWRLTTFLLCCYGFFKEIRPSEPFLTEYLISNHTGVTEEQVYHDVYPVWTYSYLAILFLVFLVTDLAKYKPVIVLEGFAYILTWVLLLWGNGLAAMQTMQVSYGVATSTEVAYFTYIYASVSGKILNEETILDIIVSLTISRTILPAGNKLLPGRFVARQIPVRSAGPDPGVLRGLRLQAAQLHLPRHGLSGHTHLFLPPCRQEHNLLPHRWSPYIVTLLN